MVQPKASVLYLIRALRMPRYRALRPGQQDCPGRCHDDRDRAGDRLCQGLLNMVINSTLERPSIRTWRPFWFPLYRGKGLCHRHKRATRTPARICQAYGGIWDHTAQKLGRLRARRLQTPHALYHFQCRSSGSTDVGDVSWVLRPRCRLYHCRHPPVTPGSMSPVIRPLLLTRVSSTQARLWVPRL